MAFKFTRLAIYPSLLSGKYHVEWDGEGGGAFSFQVEWAPTETGPWLSAGPEVVSLDTTVEVKERPLSSIDALWFKVVAIDSGGSKYQSSPAQQSDTPNRQDFLRYREMLRRLNLELKKFTGTKGCLFRLKTFGELANNVHPILGQPIGTEDSSGLGQKFKGGYWPGLFMFVGYSPDPPDVIPTEESGASEPVAKEFTAMPFPQIKPNDIWVDPTSDTRYRVLSVNSVAFIGFRVKQIVNISRLPITDPAYKLSTR